MCVCVCVRLIYLQPVCGQGLSSLHDDLLNPLDREVTSSLLQPLAEEADHLRGERNREGRSKTHTRLYHRAVGRRRSRCLELRRRRCSGHTRRDDTVRNAFQTQERLDGFH